MFENLEEKPEGEEQNDATAAAMAPDDSFASSDTKPASKLSVIGFFVIVAGGAIFSFIHMRSGPSAASAAVPNVQANQTISQFLSGGANDIQNMKTSLANTEKQVQVFQNYPSVHQVPLGNLKTNPFAYKGDDKTDAELARKRAEQQAVMEKSAGDLKLQSIMYSSRPNGRSACMINGSLCAIGEQIAGFTVEKINPNTVTIVQSDFHFDLKLEK